MNKTLFKKKTVLKRISIPRYVHGLAIILFLEGDYIKKGPLCPYCHRRLEWDGYLKEWICPDCGRINTELNHVHAGKYR